MKHAERKYGAVPEHGAVNRAATDAIQACFMMHRRGRMVAVVYLSREEASGTNVTDPQAEGPSSLSSSRKHTVSHLPPIQFMLACENATQDMAQNLHLSGIIERLTASSFPMMLPRFFIVFGLHNVLPAVYSTKIVIEHEDGTLVLDQAMPDTAVPSHVTRARIVMGVQNLVWPKPGNYVLKLVLRGEVAGAFTIEAQQGTVPGIIIQQPPPQPPQV